MSGQSSCCWRIRMMAVVVAVTVVMGAPATVMGRKVSVSTIKVAPYLTVNNDTGQNVYDGFLHELLLKVAAVSGVRFTLTVNTEFGQPLEDGNWTGVIGDVTSGKVELAAAPLTVTAQRRKVVHFSVPFQQFGPAIVLKRPSSTTLTFRERVTHVFSPLAYTVWLMALLAYLVTSVVLYVICHCNPYEWRHLCLDRQATHREAESFTCMNTFWFVLSTWMWQGYIRAPRSLGGRLVVTFWWLFVVVFLITYTASLTNLLRHGPAPLQHQQYVKVLGLEDLATQSDVQFGFVKGGSTEVYLKNSHLPHLRRLWSTVQQRGNYVADIEEGIQRVRNAPESSPFAFITESTMARYLLLQKPCDMYMVGDRTVTGSYALAFSPGWALADSLDSALLKMQENGSLRMLEDLWFSGPCTAHNLDPSNVDKAEVAPFTAVTLGSFSGVFVILMAGVVLGALVTLFEIVIFRLAEMSPSDDEADQQLNKRNEGAAKPKGDNTTHRTVVKAQNATAV